MEIVEEPNREGWCLVTKSNGKSGLIPVDYCLTETTKSKIKCTQEIWVEVWKQYTAQNFEELDLKV